MVFREEKRHARKKDPVKVNLEQRCGLLKQLETVASCTRARRRGGGSGRCVQRGGGQEESDGNIII